MSAQKIPLFGGVPRPLPDGGVALDVFTPPDKALKPVGMQAYYEVHLWALFQADEETQAITIEAVPDSDPSAARVIWTGLKSELQPTPAPAQPLKVLCGYPVRGNITLQASGSNGNAFPDGAQLFGYYYRVGQGELKQDARRFIGAPSADGGLSVGVPITISPGNSAVIHLFERNTFDEIALALLPLETVGDAVLIFEDVANNPVSGSGEITIQVDRAIPHPIWDVQQGVYLIDQTPFGSHPDLHHLRVRWDGAGEGNDLCVHGYFTRRGTGTPPREG